ncbi:MAG TPA: ABC transporter substrate-binding protein [Thermoleophilaceae bacterium]|nr:ABC transporter substrate-binding protein [Thermoleophilaceae bacterium]
MRRTRLALALALTLLLIAVASGCGEKEDVLEAGTPEPFTLMLDYFPNADHAGIYAAEAADEFGDAGLDLEIRQPPDPAAPIKQVAAGRVDLALSYEPEVLRARDQGLRVVSVGALVRKPLTSIVSLPKARIRSPRDLEGKTVGTAGIDYQSAYLRTILTDAGVDPGTVRERNVGFALTPALLTGKVDAVLGAFWNYEGTELRRKGRDPRIIRMERAGVPTYDELVLVANASALERDGGRIRAFVSALARGTRALARDPSRGIQGLLDANPDLDPGLQRAVVRVTLPLLLPPRGRPFGFQDPGEWQAFTAWMRENRLLTEIPHATGAFTNELLPGQGL